MLDIKVYINNEAVSVAPIIEVSDRDSIQFELSSLNTDYFNIRNVELFLEDYKIPLTLVESKLSLKSQYNNLFRESFGYSNVRAFVDDELFYEIAFNVSTNQEKFENIKGMMSYLLANNERILDVCFSRTKYKAKNDGEYDASFDSIIALAEKIVSSCEERKYILSKELRHKLELVKEPANNRNYYNISPYDVIDNLEQIYQGYSPNSLTLFGKVYSLDNISRENHIDSYNLIENQILLGGLVSIKEALLEISSSIESKSFEPNHDKEYEVIRLHHKPDNFVIEDLYVQLTTAGMAKRINSVLKSIDELLHIFQKRLRVEFNGYIRPTLTAYAKKSSFYLLVYNYLNEWYCLGSPDVGIDHDLTKIRSTSKIYEFFTLYKLIDKLYLDGWKVTKSVESSYFKRFIPSQVDFKKEESVLTIYYEKKVYGFSKNTQHNDLVALNKNNTRNKYNYYNPDFLLVKRKDDCISYYILDSKYSSSRTLQEYKVLDNIFEKYFVNFATYNSISNSLEKDSIKCVMAIHPFGNHEISKWATKLPTIIPQISSVLLSQTKNNLDQIVDLVNS